MKKVTLFVLAILMLASIAACAPAAPAAPAAKPEENANAPASDELYIEVSALSSLDYFYDHMLGCEMAGKELGVRTEYVGPSDYDMNAMVAAFEQAIAKKPNGICVVGFEDVLTPVIKKAMDAGIPVVTLDADLPDSDRIAFVGTGNFTAGKVGGDYLAKAINETGKVAIMTKPGQSNLEERISGYQAALAAYPGIEIVQIADTQSDPVIAAQAAAALLQKYPDLVGIACVEAAGGSGAATAVKEAGRAGQVAIMSMDRSEDVLTAIEEGLVTGSVAQQTALMPYYGIQLMMNLNRSKVAITSDNKAAGVLGVPAVIDTGAIIINKDNAKYFKR